MIDTTYEQEAFDIHAAPEFTPFSKIARLSRECCVTEKIDGTNAQVYINDYGDVFAGSRTRWITPQQDNFGFARWVEGNRQELLKLGPGAHFGEWWGSGIQRRYNMKEKMFSLFNVSKWGDPAIRPSCCCVVPTLYHGLFDTLPIKMALDELARIGSIAAPGFMDPEGIVIYHEASKTLFKKTIKNDASPKSELPE